MTTELFQITFGLFLLLFTVELAYEFYRINLIQKPFNENHRTIIILLLILILFWVSVESIPVLVPGQITNILHSVVLSSLLPIILTLIILLIGKSIEMFIEPQMSKFLLTVGTGSISIQLFLIGVKLFTATTQDQNLFREINLISYILLLITLIVVGWKILNDLKFFINHITTQSQKDHFEYLRIASIIFILTLISTVLESTLHHYFGLLYILGSGILVYNFSNTYLTDPEVMFLYPNESFIILLIDNIGTVRYMKNFVKQRSEGEITVLTNYLNLFNNFLEDLYQDIGNKTKSEKITSIEYQDYMILFEQIANLNITLALFTPVDNQFLRDSMHKVVNWFENNDSQKIKQRLNSPEYIDLDDIINQYFYYLEE